MTDRNKNSRKLYTGFFEGVCRGIKKTPTSTMRLSGSEVFYNKKTWVGVMVIVNLGYFSGCSQISFSTRSFCNEVTEASSSLQLIGIPRDGDTALPLFWRVMLKIKRYLATATSSLVGLKNLWQEHNHCHNGCRKN